MLGQQIRFEWHVAEEQSPWAELFDDDRLPGLVGALSDAEYRLAIRFLRALIALMVGIVALGGVAQTPAERARIRATAGIQASLARDLATQPENADVADRKLLAVNVVDGVAFADILVDEPTVGWRSSSPYRETRFYTETEFGWMRTHPDAALWGGKRFGETEHLTFEYFEPDAEVVAAVAPRLEESYVRLYELIGLDLPSADEKVVVEILPAAIRGRGIYEGRIETASPFFSQIPEGMSDEAYLAHRVTNRLLYGIVSWADNEREPMYTNVYHWRTLQRGLRTWLQTELMGEPWPWDQESDDLLRRAITWRYTFELDDVSDWNAGRALDRENLMLQYAIAASVIDFAVDTYGHDSLIPLIKGFTDYSTWQQLTRGVYGVSAAEFERNWNLYLREKYGSQAE